MFRILQNNRRIIPIALFFGFFTASAQTVWNKTYIENKPAMIFGSVISADSMFVVTGTTNGTNINTSKALLGKVVQNGLLADYDIFDDSTTFSYNLYSNALIQNEKGNFIFTGTSDDTVSRLLFGVANKARDSVLIFRYYTPNSYSFAGSGLIQYSGAYYVAGQFIDKTAADGDMVLVKIDSLGNRLWQKYYDQYRRDLATSIMVLNNGNLMLGGSRTDLDNTHAHANSWLLEVDTGGHIIRQWFDSNDSTYDVKGLIQTSDGGFLYGAQKKYEQTVNDILMTALLVKLDNNFNKEWVYDGGVRGNITGFTDIEHIADSTYIACGNYSNGQAWVIMFTESGIILWEKKYKGLQDVTSTWNVLKDIDVLPDGSFIAAGYCQRIVNPNGLAPQEGWLLKLDKNGCEMESCLVGIEDPKIATDNLNLNIYPNPAHNEVNIQFDNLPLTSVLHIFDATGILIETLSITSSTEKIILNTCNYTNGIYLARVEAHGKTLMKGNFIVLR